MKFFLPIIFLLYISQSVLGERKSSRRKELSYQELKDLNVSCFPWDTCSEDRQKDYPVVLDIKYKCSCHSQCWEFGTCCIDSPHRIKPAIFKCRNVGVTLRDRGYYMVDRCPDKTDTRSIWKIHCDKEKEDGDLLMSTPITSLDTSLIYKNYFCFKCHETTDNYASWDLNVSSFNVSGTKVNSVSYDQEQKTWMANYDENPISFSADLSFEPPDNLEEGPFSCDPDMIADCPDTWTDRRVREKCHAYTAVVYRGFGTYKNIHCALCNDVRLGTTSCNAPSVRGYAFRPDRILKNTLKVTSGDEIGNPKKCVKNHVWSPVEEKCRKVLCPNPEHVIKNNRCRKP